MGEYGFEVAQRGVDVGKAAEWQKTASSKWTYLKIKHQGYFASPDATFDPGTNHTIFEHDLGYLSPYLVFTTNAGESLMDQSHVISNDRTKLYNTTHSNSAYNLYYIIFDYNLDSTPPIDDNNPGAESSGAKNEVGIKAIRTDGVVNPAKIASGDYRDYSFNTGEKNMAVHSNGSIFPNADSQIKIQHNLGYLPTYLLYTYSPDTDAIQFVNNIISSDNQTLTVRGAQAPLSQTTKHYFLIFKEPFATTL